MKQKTKRIENNIFELEKSLSSFRKYGNCDYDDLEFRGKRDVGSLFNKNTFNQSIDVDYYKLIKTKSAFNSNYIEYESKGDKDKNLQSNEYVDMIRPNLRDIINDHKTPKNVRVHLSNKIIDYETQFGDWKTQSTMSINFISSRDSDKIHNMYIQSDNIEIMMGSETNVIIEELRESLL